MSKITLTAEQREAYQKELEYLETVKFEENKQKILVARSNGKDICDNEEYDEAKREQSELYAKIDELKALLADSRV